MIAVAGGGLVVLRVTRSSRAGRPGVPPTPRDDVAPRGAHPVRDAATAPVDVAPAEPGARVPTAPLG